MAEFLISLAVGTLLGALAGLGTGGGSLLLLWLTLIMGMPQQGARSINLLFFLPGALIASFLRRKQGVLEVKKLIPAMVAGCLAAAAGSLLSRVLDTEILKKCFGALLLYTGARELRWKGAGNQRRRKAR